MAGALGVRLSGPRMYDGAAKNEPWLNAGALDPDAKTLKNGLRLYLRAMTAMALALAALAAAP
jgi:adenosylcobinamide-phosphate synthase